MAVPRALDRARGGVADGGPVRIPTALPGSRVRQEEDELLHGLEAAPLHRETAPGPSEEVPFALLRRHRREGARSAAEQRVQRGALERPEEPTEAATLLWADVRFDDPREVAVDAQIARASAVEAARIRGDVERGHEGVRDEAEGPPLRRRQRCRHGARGRMAPCGKVLPSRMGACIYPRATSRVLGESRPCPSTKPSRRTSSDGRCKSSRKRT